MIFSLFSRGKFLGQNGPKFLNKLSKSCENFRKVVKNLSHRNVWTRPRRRSSASLHSAARNGGHPRRRAHARRPPLRATRPYGSGNVREARLRDRARRWWRESALFTPAAGHGMLFRGYSIQPGSCRSSWRGRPRCNGVDLALTWSHCDPFGLLQPPGTAPRREPFNPGRIMPGRGICMSGFWTPPARLRGPPSAR